MKYQKIMKHSLFILLTSFFFVFSGCLYFPPFEIGNAKTDADISSVGTVWLVPTKDSYQKNIDKEIVLEVHCNTGTATAASVGIKIMYDGTCLQGNYIDEADFPLAAASSKIEQQEIIAAGFAISGVEASEDLHMYNVTFSITDPEKLFTNGTMVVVQVEKLTDAEPNPIGTPSGSILSLLPIN